MGRVPVVSLLLAGLLWGCSPGTDSSGDGTVTIFAAASTTNAVTEVVELFSASEKTEVVTSFAASSTLARQIDSGAPADIYLSANRKWMDYLEERGRIDPGNRLDLLGNRIVLIAPAGRFREVRTVTGELSLTAMLGDGHLAMGDPDHVPAGIYGREILESLGIWEHVRHRVARTKDVRAALALVERGEAVLGLVYATDAAVSDGIAVVGTFPPESQPPIVYPVALTAGSDMPAAGRFLEFLGTREAREVFERHGFKVF
jgi:molybdate transport system substrate-binding protein